jgi:hypothetical protein
MWGPGVIAALIGILGIHLYSPRYYAASSIPLLVLAAIGLTGLPRRIGVLAVTLLILTAVPSIVSQRATDGHWGENLRAAALAVARAPRKSPIYFLQPKARSLAAAYPAEMGSRAQVPGSAQARASGTLWGTSRLNVRRVLQRASGKTAILVSLSGQTGLTAAKLARAGCMVEATTLTKRITVTELKC